MDQNEINNILAEYTSKLDVCNNTLTSLIGHPNDDELQATILQVHDEVLHILNEVVEVLNSL